MHIQSWETLCPLCQSESGAQFYEDRRTFYRCSECLLVFVSPCQYLSRDEEKSEYDRHENSPADTGYREFLSRLFHPVSQLIQPGSTGLDFGSGPGPTLSVMFSEAGHKMQIYDPIYAPDYSLLKQQYQFITASEVVEHLHHPRNELELLWSCLERSGVLGIMTKRVIDKESFSRWHYKDDLTHVCFYSLKTFEWLAIQWNATLWVPGKDVVIFKKQ